MCRTFHCNNYGFWLRQNTYFRGRREAREKTLHVPKQQSLHSSWNWKEKWQFEQFSMQKSNSKKDLVHQCTIEKYFEHSSTCGQDFWIACNNRSDIVMSMPCDKLSQHKDNRWFTISLKSVITERWYRNKFERLILILPN